MRLSSLADYAVVMMAAAARHPAGARLSATLLAADTGVPLPTAQKLMGRLAASGLLTSARGTGGGFQLARPAGGISLADIIEAVEGPIAMTNCVDERRHDCALDAHCQVKPHLSAVNGAVRGALAAVSLHQLSQSVTTPSPVRPEPVEGLPFSSPPAKKEWASTSSARTGLDTEVILP
jgi:FeS assembly SUF system regulator